MAAGSRRWHDVCALVRAEGRPCWLCGKPIDYTLGRYDPMSFSGDHILPTNLGGQDTYENCAASHLKCN